MLIEQEINLHLTDSLLPLCDFHPYPNITERDI